jgi:hypothetical protein
VKSALARYANDARGLSKIKGLLNNCDYISEGTKAYIESKRDIPAGTEIFVDYGKDYWKVIRENMKLWAREKKEAEKKAAAAKKKSTVKKGKTIRRVQPANGKKLNGTYHVNSRKALKRNRAQRVKKATAK